MDSHYELHRSIPIKLYQRLVLAAATALWLALLAAVAGRYMWPLELFAHFRVQYAVLFIAFAVALALLERRALAALSLAGALLSAVPTAAYLRWSPAAATASPGSFRLVSFNIWFRNDDAARVARYLEHTKADAIVLQELTNAQAVELRARLKSYPYSYIEPGRFGAAVFTRWPIAAKAAVPLSAEAARAAQVVIDWHGSKVTVVGVHLHWPLGPRSFRRRNRELNALAALAHARSGPLLVAGDFNITPWSGYYQELIARSALSDCAAGHGIAASWPAQFPPLGIPIDHCLASRHWRSVDVTTGPYLGSDHRPLIADLVLQP